MRGLRHGLLDHDAGRPAWPRSHSRAFTDARVVTPLIPSDKAKGLCLAVSGYGLVHLGNVFVRAAGKKCKVEVKWAYSPVYRAKQCSCKK